jgi:hypothetical protein
MREQDRLSDGSGDELGPGERELETALKSLSPARPGVDAVGAAFSAGRHSGRREARLWRGAAGVFLLALAGSWVVPARHRGGPPVVESPALVSVPAASSVVRPPSQSLIMLDKAVRDGGLDALPDAGLPPAQAVRARDRV